MMGAPCRGSSCETSVEATHYSVHHTHASLLFWTEAVASVRADELVHCCTLQHRSTGPARSATARRSAGSAAAALHTRTPLLLFSYIFFNRLFSSVLLFNVYAVQCSAVPCRCAQHRCTAVSACTQPCWCAAGRNEAAAASPLPSPLLFCSSPGRTAAWRTEHSYNAAPSVLELQRCTSSARLPLQHTFHKKNL